MRKEFNEQMKRGHDLKGRKRNDIQQNIITTLRDLSANFVTLFLEAKPQKAKGYLWFRVVVIEVVEGAVVGVVGFVQQLYCQRPAERLRHKRVLEDKQREGANKEDGLKTLVCLSDKPLRSQEFKC